MANEEHLRRLLQGVKRWNQWRREYRNIRPDLRNADLRDIELDNANLSNADLRDTNLTKTNMARVNLRRADLINASLCGVDLSEADLSYADLRFANLTEAKLRRTFLRVTNLCGVDLGKADLSHADLSYAGLIGASLSGAKTRETIFSYIDLRKTKGLAEMDHQGPSHVELYTMQFPQGGGTLRFLRGAGVPDEWIDFYYAQVFSPLQYHSLFISYSSKDEMLARRLYADLQDQGVRCWFAPEDMKIGDKIRDRIDEAIYVQEKLLLLLSEHAIASAWVEDEVEAALEKEQRQQREVLFPVRLDKSVMQTSAAWAAKLRRMRHIGDFTCWTDPQGYQRAFERLLRDLKAGSQKG